jgi:hypothetical protein
MVAGEIAAGLAPREIRRWRLGRWIGRWVPAWAAGRARLGRCMAAAAGPTCMHGRRAPTGMHGRRTAGRRAWGDGRSAAGRLGGRSRCASWHALVVAGGDDE